MQISNFKAPSGGAPTEIKSKKAQSSNKDATCKQEFKKRYKREKGARKAAEQFATVTQCALRRANREIDERDRELDRLRKQLAEKDCELTDALRGKDGFVYLKERGDLDE